ncbi:MAG: nucleotidyltransferase domain-containing protein [Candidatus Shapirobacteria bacterium]
MSTVEIKDRLNFNEIEISGPIGVDIFLSEEGKDRRDLYKKLKNIFNKIPDVNMDFDEAYEKDLVGNEDLIDIYDGLGKFIEEDVENNSRIILYLPSQLLPNMEKEINGEILRKSRKKFSEVYKKSWIRLLFEEDWRADFVDGDILEAGLGEPVPVRKVAHLVSDILEKKIIDYEEIKKIVNVCDDENLKINLTEGLIVAADKKIVNFDFDEKLVDKLFDLQKPKIDKSFIISRARIRWENQVKKEKETEKKSEVICQKIIDGEIEFSEINEIAEIVGIFKAGEKINLIEKYLPLVYDCWIKNKNIFENDIKSGLSHWKNLGIISDEVLEKFKTKLPEFNQLMAIKTKEMVKKDFEIFREAVIKIKEDGELMKYIYPTFLVFGSRVKGYAGVEADIDAAIFFRPETTFERREEILERLHQKIPALKTVEKILEYWIDKKDEKFGFKNPEQNGKIIGVKEIHIFWNGIWISSNNEFKKISQDITKKYLNLERFGKQKKTIITVFLLKLEMDIIQNRFMHKGYRYFYPSKKSKGTVHSDLIDWQSDFWEPEFRRIATQLFLSRVFLPEIR